MFSFLVVHFSNNHGTEPWTLAVQVKIVNNFFPEESIRKRAMVFAGDPNEKLSNAHCYPLSPRERVRVRGNRTSK